MDCSKMWPRISTSTSLPPSLAVVGRLVRRPVVVGGEVLEVAAYLVGDGEPVEVGIVGEQAAVVGRDVQGGVADVDRPEQAPEVLPDRPRVVGVVVLVGFAGWSRRAGARGPRRRHRTGCGRGASACWPEPRAGRRPGSPGKDARRRPPACRRSGRRTPWSARGRPSPRRSSSS